MLLAALEMQMANEDICDQWEDDLQKERVSWEASGDPTSYGVSLMPGRNLGKKLLLFLFPGVDGNKRP